MRIVWMAFCGGRRGREPVGLQSRQLTFVVVVVVVPLHRYRLFTNLRDRGLLHTMPTLLPGRLSSGLTAVLGLIADHALR